MFEQRHPPVPTGWRRALGANATPGTDSAALLELSRPRTPHSPAAVFAPWAAHRTRP